MRIAHLRVVVAALPAIVACSRKDATTTELNLRLQWVPQAQFAGFLVASAKGFYAANRVKVNVLPAGPDLKPHLTVASGSDQIGIAVPNQILLARSQGVPLVAIAQVFQSSANRYVLKRRNAITSLRQLRGRKVGLWTGGDEAEFVAMLRSAGMTLKDVDVVAQGFSVAPFLRDAYVLSQVTVYNELNQIMREGFPAESLQIIAPEEYRAAIPGDVVITTDRYLRENSGVVERFLAASIQGWAYCSANRQECLEIVLKANPELERVDQEAQLNAVLELVEGGAAKKFGIGYIDKSAYEIARNVLSMSGQLEGAVNVDRTFSLGAWKRATELARLPH